MHKEQFDSLINPVAGAARRREVLRALGTLSVAALGGLGLAAPSAAKKKRKRKPAVARLPVVRFGPAESNEDVFIQSFANCNPGEHAVGGGFEMSITADITFLSSAPDPLTDGTTPTSWFASVQTTSASQKTIRAYAVCLPD
jgi:hypothetical protein